MTLRRRWDIQTRTQLISLGPALLLTLLLISFFTFVRLQDLRQELNHTGQLIANQLAPATEYGVISGNNEGLESLYALLEQLIRPLIGVGLPQPALEVSALYHEWQFRRLPPYQQQGEATIDLLPGEMFVVPRGIEHCPRADEEAGFLIAGLNVTSTAAGGKPNL